MQVADLDDESDILYAQLGVGVERTPYCLVADHQTKSLVLAIRGTLNLDDLAADLKLLPAPLDDWGRECGFDGNQQYAHAGVLARTAWLYKDVEKQSVLDRASQSPAFDGYRLCVVGHSLGAATAALLSVFLRNRFPEIRCLCFSPPGCVLSPRLAEGCTEFLTSYVLDCDIVPRLSLSSMTSLRDNVLDMVARIKTSKYRVLRKIKEVDLEQAVPLMVHDADCIPDSPYRDQLKLFQLHQRSK